MQLGVSVKGGAEAAVHAVGKFISNKIGDHALQTCLDRATEIA